MEDLTMKDLTKNIFTCAGGIAGIYFFKDAFTPREETPLKEAMIIYGISLASSMIIRTLYDKTYNQNKEQLPNNNSLEQILNDQFSSTLPLYLPLYLLDSKLRVNMFSISTSARMGARIGARVGENLADDSEALLESSISKEFEELLELVEGLAKDSGEGVKNHLNNLSVYVGKYLEESINYFSQDLSNPNSKVGKAQADKVGHSEEEYLGLR